MIELYRRWAEPLVVALILLFFLTTVAPVAHGNTFSSAWDQGAYLRLGLQIRHGLALTDGNRHPLLPLLLAPFTRTDIGYFSAAKFLSLILGLAGLLTVYWAARRTLSPPWAAAATLLLAANTHYRIAAGYVDAEVLFVPLTLLGWQQTAQTVQRAAENHPHAGRSALVAGLLGGLAYLSKGTASLLALAFGLTALLVFGPGALKRRWLWLYAAGFALVAAPLWVYNLFTYGSPLYNVNTTHVMWLDYWDARFTFAPSELPTALTYLQTHSPVDVARRLLDGLLCAPWQWYQAAHLFWMPHAPPAWLVWTSAGAGVALLGGVVVLARQRWAQRSRWERRKVKFWLGLGLCALFYVMFAWYTPVDDSARFVLPAAPILYLALCWTLQTAFARSHAKHGNEQIVVWIACALFCLTYTLINLSNLPLWLDLPARDRVENSASVQFIDQLLARTRPGERVVLGPTLALADWLAFDRDILPIPYIRQDWRSFSAWAVENGVQAVVLDYESWDWRRPLLAQYFDFQDGLIAGELPAGWTLAYPAAMPCNPCLFAFDGTSTVDLEPDYPLGLRYGDTFALIGFDLDPAGRIVLFWQSLARTADDLHVFVHLLDAGGRLVGQHDSVMAEGRLPARVVMPNQIVRDVHPLPALPDGDYTLHAGLYEWATWQRLAAVSMAAPAPTDYPPIGLIRVQDGRFVVLQTD